jgi:hypothetical protein
LADYTNSKKAGMPAVNPQTGATSPAEIFPDAAISASWTRMGPLVEPRTLRAIYLQGLRLISPETRQEVGDEVLEQFIKDSVTTTEAEFDGSIYIGPTQLNERYAFDHNEFMSLGYFSLRQRPVSSVEQLQVVTANGQQIWLVSNDWIDPGYMAKGLIYIIPINVANATAASSANTQGGVGVGGAAFLAMMGLKGPWVPAYWSITYTVGFPDMRLPGPINQLIAVNACIELLGQLAASNAKHQSHSLGIDGLSQSASHAGPQLYSTRIEQLEKKKAKLIKSIKNYYGMTWFSGYV